MAAESVVSLRLRILEEGLANLTSMIGELDRAGSATDALKQQADALSAELERLKSTQTDTGTSATELGSALDKADATLGATQASARRLADELGTAGSAATGAAKASTQLTEAQQRAADALRDANTRAEATAASQRALGLATSNTASQAQQAATQQAKEADALAGLERAAQAAAESLLKAGGSSEVFSKDLQPDPVRALVSELEKLGTAVDPAVAARAKTLADEIQRLGTQRDAVAALEQLRGRADGLRNSMAAADEAVDSYTQMIGGASKATAEEAQQLTLLTERSRLARVAWLEHNGAVHSAETGLREMGVAVDRTASAERTAATEAGRAAAATASLGRAAIATEAEVSALGTKLTDVARAAGAFFAAQTSAQAVGDILKLADAWQNMQSRLHLALGEQTNMAQALADVERIALQTHSALDGTAELYGKLALAGREIGISQQDALRLTETINQAVQLSGVSAEASQAAITQLIQGLQSGVLRGDEFNSVVEQSPRLARAMADGLGVTIGQLRNMANEGQLTTQTIVKALQQQGATLDAEFGKLPLTVGRALQDVRTQWATLVGEWDSSNGASARVAQGIEAVATHLDELVAVATRAGAVVVAAMAVQAVGALRAAAAEMSITGAAAKVLAADLATLGKPVQIVIAVVGLEAGYQVGRMLYDNSEYARKLGIALTAFFENIVSDLQLVKEAGEAIFTDDTIGQAFDRYRQRGKEMDAIFSQLWKDAEKAPVPIKAATDQAAESTAKLGAAGQAAGAQLASGAAAGATGMSSVGSAAATAQSAIAAMAESAKAKLPQIGPSISENIDLMVKLAGKSNDAAKAVRDNLAVEIKKLSGPELEKFRDSMIAGLTLSRQEADLLAGKLSVVGEAGKKAFQEVAAKAELLRQVLVATGARAAEALGVDLVAASSRVSAEFQVAADNLAVLIRSLGALKAQGVDTGRVVQEALAKMIDGARNQAELDALKARIEALGKAGAVSKQQLGEMFDSLQAKTDSLTKGVNSVAEAMKLFGLTSTAEAKKAADAFEQAWKRIESDGTVTMDNKRKAFQQYAESVIASGDKVKIAALGLKAGFYDLEIANDAAGKSFVRAKGGLDSYNAGMRDSISLTAGEINGAKLISQQLDVMTAARERSIAAREQEIAVQERQNAVTEREIALKNKARNVDANGFSLDKTGTQTINAGGNTYLSVLNELKQYGLTDEQARSVARDFVDANGQVPYMNNPGQAKWHGSTLSEAISAAAQAALFGADRTGATQPSATGSSTGSSGPTGTGSSTSSTGSTVTNSPTKTNVYQTVLNLPGRATVTVQSATASEQTSLHALINELAADSRRAN